MEHKDEGPSLLEKVQALELQRAAFEDALHRQQELEKRLRESEERLRTLINATPDIICFKDGEGRWLEANDADLALFELKDVAYQGLKDSDLAAYSDFYHDAFMECEETDEEAWRKGGLSRGDEVIPRPDGTAKIYDVIKVPLFAGDGSRRGLVVLGRDITELRHAERALAKEKELLAVTLDAIPEGVISVGSDGRIKLLNQAASTLLKSSRQETQGAVFEEVFVLRKEGGGGVIETPLSQLLAGLEAVRERGLLLERSGEEPLPIGLRSSLVRGQEGAIQGAVFVFWDETESRRKEEERLRTQKLESLELLAAGIAHDFNNMLTAFVGQVALARLLLEPTHAAQKPLGEAELAVERAAQLTRQLLMFASEQAPRREVIDFGALIEEAASLCLSGTATRSTFSLDAELWPVEAESGQIHQVLHNLILNTVQALDGKGEISFEAVNTEVSASSGLPLHPGRYVRLEILDDGPGIPTALLERVFDPYFTTREGGTGLGLATARSIILRHSGCLQLGQRPAGGTVARIYLPAAHDVPPAQEEERKERRVLLLDDDPMIGKALSLHLEHAGFQVVVATQGDQALRRFEEALREGRAFDAVVLDLTVPGDLSAPAALSRMRALVPTLPAILISGRAAEEVFEQAKASGFQKAFTKPFLPRDLCCAVTTLLEAQGA